MKKVIFVYFPLFAIVFSLLLIISCKENDPTITPELGSFTDLRDGHIYKTVAIGSQIWFAENLAFEGEGREITDDDLWINNADFDGWRYYENNKATYGSTYGVLYQWEAAKAACPPGWHVPTIAEWVTLSDYLGGDGVSGSKLKESGTTHWNDPNTGATNETGFAALPGGISDNANFELIGQYGFWWSSSDDGNNLIPCRGMNYGGRNMNALNNDHPKYAGLSVRCLKD